MPANKTNKSSRN